MYGAKRLSSILTRFALSASQCASSPSPSEDTMPIPVIQTSFGSAMHNRLQREADLCGHRVHMHAQGRVGEGDMAEGEVGAALQLGADARLCRGDGKTRAFVLDLRFDRQQLAGTNETPHLGFLHHRQERHALELHHAEQKPAGALRHRFGQQNTGHYWKAWKVPLEDGAMFRNLRLDRDGFLSHIEVEDAVDQLKIFKLHGG